MNVPTIEKPGLIRARAGFNCKTIGGRWRPPVDFENLVFLWPPSAAFAALRAAKAAEGAARYARGGQTTSGNTFVDRIGH